MKQIALAIFAASVFMADAWITSANKENTAQGGLYFIFVFICLMGIVFS